MIIILGATGTIGKYVVNILSDQNKNFIVVGRNEKKVKKIFPHVNFRYGDLSCIDSLEKAFIDANHLFLVSPNNEMMVHHQLNAIRAASKLGIKNVVKISGSYGTVNQNSDYTIGGNHWLIEQKLKQMIPNFVILRCNFFMQNLLIDIAKTVKLKNKIFFPLSKNMPFCFLDAKDIASCVIECMENTEHFQKTYELTGPCSSFLELETILSEVLKKKIKYCQFPIWLAKFIMKFQGKSEWLINHNMEMIKFFQNGGSSAESSTLYEILKRPPNSLKSFINENLISFQS